MMVASFGAGGAVSLSPMQSSAQSQAADAGQATSSKGAESVGGSSNRTQVNEVIGDRSASNGDGVQYRSSDVLSDGTIRDMLFTFLIEDGKDEKSKNSASALLFAKELYSAVNQLQNMSSGNNLGVGGGVGGISGGGGGGGAVI